MRGPSTTVRILLMSLVVLVPSCAGDGRWFSGEPSPRAQEIPEVDRDAVTLAVEDFLDALAGKTGASSLPGTVRGPFLQDWAASVGRRGGEAAGGGTVEIRTLRVVTVQGDVARADLDATVTLGVPADLAGTAEVTFAGPVALVRDAGAAAGWAVSDLVREDRPMSVAITVFQPPARGAGQGIEVEVRSLYRFATGTVANVSITNETSGGVRMDRRRTRVQAAGRFVGATGASGDLLEELPAGASPAGSVRFHPVPLQWLPEKVMVQLADGAVVTVDLPVEAFIPPTAEA